MIVVYYSSATGEASSVLQAPDLGGFPEAAAGFLALMLESPVQLPGYVQGTTYTPLPPPPTPAHVFNWATKQWEDPRTLDQIKAEALDQVDIAAGKARLRYITSVPGQAETYQKKEQQAREWAAASFAGDPPSFIAAEAAALGRDPQAVATEVIGLADYWGNVKGPQIEACRRKWKVAIEAATDSTHVDSLLASARAELEAL